MEYVTSASYWGDRMKDDGKSALNSPASMHQQLIRCNAREWSAAVERVQLQFRGGYGPNVRLLSAHLVRHVMVITLAVLISEWFKSWPVYLVAVMLIGAHQVGIGTIGFHEGAHSLLYRKNEWNHRVGKILVTLVGGQVVYGYEQYKARHLTHHRYLNRALDPEVWKTLDIKRTPVWRHALFFLSVICGVQYVRLCIGYMQKLCRFRRFISLALLLISSALVAAGAVLGVDACVLLVKYWLLPFATWGLTAFYIFSYSEHPCVDQADDQLLVAYTHEIAPTWFDAMFVSTSGFNYHLSHHLAPWLPFYHLPKVHRAVAADPVLGRAGNIYHGYHRVLFAVLGSHS